MNDTIINKNNLASAPFFQNGFRPFFLGAAVIAIVNLLIWLLYVSGNMEIPSLFTPTIWHMHEMIFGFIGAAIAGFLLTAVPNWTGRPALKNWNLILLFGLWLMGRIVVFYSEYTQGVIAALVDLPFFFLLSLYLFNELKKSGNKRNYPIAILLLSFGFANMLMHVEIIFDIETAIYGYRLAIILVALLIMIIGGRIIPNFTNNWLKQHKISKLAPSMNKFDMLAIMVSLVGLIGWIIAPESYVIGVILCVAGGLQLLRVLRWRGYLIFKNPILLIMQISYFWLALALFLLGLFIMTGNSQLDIPLHILTLGTFSVMILAIMTRATLGHTGRKIVASKITVFVYIFINLSLLFRILAPIIDIAYLPFLHISGLMWLLSFGLFLFQYAPYMFMRRK